MCENVAGTRDEKEKRKEILVTRKLNVEWSGEEKKKEEEDEERGREGEVYPAYQSHVSDLAWPGLQFHGCE